MFSIVHVRLILSEVAILFVKVLKLQAAIRYSEDDLQGAQVCFLELMAHKINIAYSANPTKYFYAKNFFGETFYIDLLCEAVANLS